jgi:hypothetical protein
MELVSPLTPTKSFARKFNSTDGAGKYSPMSPSCSPTRKAAKCNGEFSSSRHKAVDGAQENTKSVRGEAPLTPSRSHQSPTPLSPKTTEKDRFIPNRADIDYDFCNHALVKSINIENEAANKNLTSGNAQQLPSAPTTPTRNNARNQLFSSVFGISDTFVSENAGVSPTRGAGGRNTTRLVDILGHGKSTRKALKVLGDEANFMKPGGIYSSAAGLNGSLGSPVGFSASNSPTRRVSVHNRFIPSQVRSLDRSCSFAICPHTRITINHRPRSAHNHNTPYPIALHSISFPLSSHTLFSTFSLI